MTDAAEAYPQAVWPEHALRALRGLIHASHAARDTGRPAIPQTVRDPLISSFRHAVPVGLSEVRRAPGPRHRTAQPPGRDLLEFCRDRETDVLRFCFDTQVWPTNNISERDLRPTKTQEKISGRLTSADVRTGWTSAATSTPSANTAPLSWPESARRSPAPPGAPAALIPT